MIIMRLIVDVDPNCTECSKQEGVYNHFIPLSTIAASSDITWNHIRKADFL